MRNEKYSPDSYCPPPTPPKKRSNPALILLLCIILAALIVIGMICMIYLTRDTAEHTEETTAKNTAVTEVPDIPDYDTVTFQYVAQWPDGFPTDSELYRTYSGQPADGGKANTLSHAGYIYWHWCRGDFYGGPINRTTSVIKDRSHTAFHAYYSTVAPDVSGEYIYDDYDNRWVINPTPDGTYHHPNTCCLDTYWFYVIDVWEQDFVIMEE